MSNSKLNPYVSAFLYILLLAITNSLAYYYLWRLDGFFGYPDVNKIRLYYYIAIFIFSALNIGLILAIWYSGIKKIIHVDCLKCNGLMSQKASICQNCHFDYEVSYRNCNQNFYEHCLNKTSAFENRYFIYYLPLGSLAYLAITYLMGYFEITSMYLKFCWSICIPMGLYFLILRKYFLGWIFIITSFIYIISYVIVISGGRELNESRLLGFYMFLGILPFCYYIFRLFIILKEFMGAILTLPKNYWLNKNLIDETGIGEFVKSSVVQCYDCN